MFSFSMSRVNMKGSRYTEDLLPNLKMTVSDTNTFIFYLFLLTKQRTHHQMSFKMAFSFSMQ